MSLRAGQRMRTVERDTVILGQPTTPVQILSTFDAVPLKESEITHDERLPLMPTATLTEENVSTMQPVTHLYELSEPYEERVTHVLVTVATNPHNADEAVVMAATAGGAAMPEASQLRLWVLHRAENRTHAEALADLGYEVGE